MELTQRRRRGTRTWQIFIFNKQKQWFCLTLHARFLLIIHFYGLLCETTTCNNPIWSPVQDVSIQRLRFKFLIILLCQFNFWAESTFFLYSERSDSSPFLVAIRLFYYGLRSTIRGANGRFSQVTAKGLLLKILSVMTLFIISLS